MKLDRHRLGDAALSLAAVGTAVAVVWLMAMRLRYAADFMDESYFAAVSYRFVLGDRPFVDEQSFLQLASLLTYPLVKAYVGLTGGTTGIILFMRVLWILFAGGVCAAGFAFLRTVTRWQVALVGSLLPLVAVPFNVPTLSYNSMGAGMLALGMAVGGLATVSGRSPRWLLIAGLAHGVAAWAYPTMALVVPVFALAVLALYRRDALKPLALYVGGAAAVGVALAAFLAWCGLDNVRTSWKYMSSLSSYAGGESKLLGIAQRASEFFVLQPVFLGSLAAAALLYLVLPRSFRRFTLLVPVLAIFPVTYSLGYTLVGFAVMLYGLAGVWLGFAVRGNEPAQRLYVWGMLPAFAGGAITAYTSSNGFMNAGIGFYPALFATTGLLAVLVIPQAAGQGEAVAREDGRLVRLLAALAPWVVGGVFVLTALHFGQYQYRTVYHDSQRKYLTHRISGGPFDGLWTRPDNFAFEQQLRKDIDAFVKPGQRVLFFDNLPGAYLYTKARPGANSLWLSWSDDMAGPQRHATLDYWRRTGNYPDTAFRFTWRVRYRKGHTLMGYIAEPRYKLEAVRGRFEIWSRRPGEGAPAARQ